MYDMDGRDLRYNPVGLLLWLGLIVMGAPFLAWLIVRAVH